MAVAGGTTSEVDADQPPPGQPTPGADAEAETGGDGSGNGGIGVCLSGGGIRAAAFGLGALQVLDERDILRRARYLAAVSGGSYIVGAVNMVECGPLETGEKAADGRRVVHPTDDQRAFSHGSPEERYLRHNLDYLISGPGGLAEVLAHAGYGFLLNILFLGLTLWVPSLMLGWLYGWLLPGLRYKEACTDTAHCVSGFQASAWVWGAACVIGGLGILCGLLWVGVPIRNRKTRNGVAGASLVLVVVAVAVVFVGILIPYLLEFLRGTGSSAIGDAVHTQSTATINSSSPLALAAFVGLGGLLVTTLLLVRKVILPRGEKNVQAADQATTAKRKGLPFSIVAAISVPLFAIGSSLLVINWGAAHPPFALKAGYPWASLAWGLAPLVLWLALVSVADVNTWSFHPYYKQHLSRAFALARVHDDETDRDDASERANEMPYKLSRSQPKNFPRFLICATANIDDRPNVPTGFKALPFVFSSETIEVPGLASVKTKEYEGRAEYRVTMPTAMAVSGAAFSPEMGAMTRKPLRALMTLANVRLGVWLPNPTKEPPHEGRRKRNLLHKGHHFLHHWYFDTPRPYYLFAELLGITCVNSRYLYVTDGGHYDNLGLVELLRRRCACIVCVDASGDKIDSFGTIGKALAIARAENLIKKFDLDPRRDLAPPPETPRFVRSSYCFGSVTYEDDSMCEVVVIKAGVTPDAPWDIRAYHESEPNFPTDSTLDQFYKAPRFDAYRALGEYSTGRAIDARLAQPEASLLREPAKIILK